MNKTTRSLVAVLSGFVLIFALSAPVALIYTEQSEENAGGRGANQLEPGPPATEAPGENAATKPGGTTEEQAAEAPAAHTGARLKVENILQNPEMPNGCEAVSLTVLFNHLGFQTTGRDLFDQYFDKEDFTYGRAAAYGPDPEYAYPGVPYEGGLGFYCFPGAVVKAANRYLAGQPGDYYAFDTTGMGEDGIFTALDEGNPVIVWITRDGEAPRYNKKFVWTIDNTDENYRPYANLHVLVATGYDDEYVYLADPLGNYEKMERPLFFTLHRQLGMRSVLVRPATFSDDKIS